MEVLDGHIYDYPRYYDLLFASDWKAEYDFLEGCFERYAQRPVYRLFEPACGTGRLLARFGKMGYEVAGNDLNQGAIDFCNRRLQRQGLPATAQLGDMARFRTRKKYDAAFNTISSFRHLPTERQATAHLRCMADALRLGGLYVLGLHLTPRGTPTCEEESWSARRGNLAVLYHMWTVDLDRRRRRETVKMVTDVYTPTRQFRLVSETVFRTYTAEQMQQLLCRVPQWEVAETFDFAYDLQQPVAVDGDVEDVVYVLRKVRR